MLSILLIVFIMFDFVLMKKLIISNENLDLFFVTFVDKFSCDSFSVYKWFFLNYERKVGTWDFALIECFTVNYLGQRMPDIFLEKSKNFP